MVTANIIGGQHDLVDAVKYLGLVLLHPRELGGGEVAGRVEQMAQALLGTQLLESLAAVGHGAAVAPDDGVAQGLALAVDTHQAVHLI